MEFPPLPSVARFRPPARVYGGYIFDCDGTLADTMPIHYRAWLGALERVGASFDFTWELFLSRAGMSVERTVHELSVQFGLPLDAAWIAREQARLYAEHEADVLPIADVVAFARDVASRAPVSVASGSLRGAVERTLTLIGARDLFSVLVTPEDVVHGKPAPDLFLLAAARMGVPPSECVVFEDAEFGFRAAKSAGMDWVVVEQREPPHEAYRTRTPGIR